MADLIFAAAALYLAFPVATLGRPALEMDRLFLNSTKYPGWHWKLAWRGRAAIALAVIVIVVVGVLVIG